MTAKRAMAILPSVGVSLLPKLTCPLCWPAYAGLLTTLGLGFLISERYLLAVTAAFLLVSIAALAFRTEYRRGYGPAIAGIIAAAVVLVGKFSLDSTPTMYAGLTLIIAASLWNSWPKKPLKTNCQSAPDNELIQLSARRNHHERDSKD